MTTKGESVRRSRKDGNTDIKRQHDQGKVYFPDPEIRALWKQIGENIRFYREARKLTAAELGVRVSLSRMSISNAEAGNQRLQVDTILRLAKVLRVPVTDLLPDPESLPELKPSSEDLTTATADRLRELRGETEKAAASGVTDRRKRS